VPTGGALLALGLREPVREALRAPLDDPRLLELFAQYAAWCGADEFVTKHWSRAEAGALGAPGAEGARRAGLLLPVAEALGLRTSATALSARGPELDVALEIPPAVQELWQVAPNGLEGAVTLAPALPAGWPEMTLERLRVAGTTLDLRVRRRPAGLAVACRRGHGPAIVVRLRPRLERPASGILVGDAQLPGPEFTTMLDDEAEGIWLT
ncbi:MAG TPA: hypothetical protein VFI13_13460, partial [Gemmatimonadales bacterium]|nr:hypothetical protein [Gemmatimonadales bacterium]